VAGLWLECSRTGDGRVKLVVIFFKDIDGDIISVNGGLVGFSQIINAVVTDLSQSAVAIPHLID